MKSINIIFILANILLGTFFSCYKQPYYPDELNWANTLINIAPDSALAILKSINNPSVLKGKAKADYALLFSQACDKNQIFHTNDSLICIAVDYYKNKRVLDAAKSYFYLGCIYRNNEQDVKAMEAYLIALEVMPKGSLDKLWMQIYFNLGERYIKQGLYDNALESYRKCLEATLPLNDSSMLFYPYNEMAYTFLFQNENDSALKYYLKAFDLAQSNGDDYQKATTLHGVSLTYLYKKDTLSAMNYLQKAIERHPSAITKFWKAKYFYLTHQLDSAELYLKKGILSKTFSSKASCFNLLSEIEKKRFNHTQAYAYIDSFNAYRDSINDLKQHENIQQLNVRHALELKKKENEQEEERLYWITGLVILCIIGSCVTFFLHIKKKHKEELLRQERLHYNDQAHNIHSYIEEKLGEEISLEETVNSFKREKLQSGINAFNQTIWKEKLEEADKIIKPGDYIKQGQEELYRELEECYHEFKEIFVKTYPNLSKDDFYFCTLSSLNFRTRLITYCMKTSGGSLRIRKNRLKKNITEDTFLMIFGN